MKLRTNEGTNARTHEHANARAHRSAHTAHEAHERTYKRTKERTSERTHKSTDERTNEPTNERANGRRNVRAGRRKWKIYSSSRLSFYLFLSFTFHIHYWCSKKFSIRLEKFGKILKLSSLDFSVQSRNSAQSFIITRKWYVSPHVLIDKSYKSVDLFVISTNIYC